MAPTIDSKRRGGCSLATAAGYATALLLGGTVRLSSSFAPIPRRDPSSARLRRAAHNVAAVGTPPVSTTSLSYQPGRKNDVGVEGGKVASRPPLVWTSWDVALSIGREEGTRMPEAWGASGARLLLRTRVQFRPYRLYDRLTEDQDRDDFLGGSSGEDVYICEVVGGQVTMGPGATESGRTLVAENGGWRIARGEGPNGSDELRFCVQLLGGQAERGDVCCPATRLYFRCGYFDLSEEGRSNKDDAQDALDSLGGQCDDISYQANQEAPLSLRQMELWIDMMKCKVDIDRVNRDLDYLYAAEPDLGLLSLSQEKNIGLSRNGAVSYQAHAGPFGLGSAYYNIGTMELKSCSNGIQKRP